MRSPKPKPTPDADTVITDLRIQIATLQAEQKAAIAIVTELRESSKWAHDSVAAWMRQGEDARAAAVDLRKLLDRVMDERTAVLAKLSYVEGYLAATQGATYERSEVVVS